VAAARPLEGRTTGDGAERRQVVYRLEGESLDAVSIRTGITDGRYSAVLEGPLAPGDPVVVGLATSRGQGSTRVPGMRGF
jgi:hypothetical protein